MDYSKIGEQRITNETVNCNNFMRTIWQHLSNFTEILHLGICLANILTHKRQHIFMKIFIASIFFVPIN